MISFSNIIKGEFLEEFSAISPGQILTAIALSFVLCLFIIFVYRATYAGVSYSQSFAACLLMLGMTTTVVILVISSNVVLSLGMVGALSIVRFRTAVKEPTDTAFMFWAIATGITCGAGYISVSILTTLLLGALFVGIHAFGKRQKNSSYMVVARFEDGSEAEGKLADLPGYCLKNKTMTGSQTELAAEVRLDDKAMESLNGLRNLPGVSEISVMRSVSGSVL